MLIFYAQLLEISFFQKYTYHKTVEDIMDYGKL